MATRVPPKRRSRRAIPEIRVVGPGKGLNRLVSDSLIDDKEASDLSNIAFVENGAVSKRFGHSQVGDALSALPKGLGVLYTDTVRQLMTVDGTALKVLIAGVWTAVTGKTFTSGKEVNFCQARTAVAIWNGNDGGGKYDGGTLSTPGTMPSASFSIFYNGYHIAAGTPTNLNRLYISVLLDAFDFTNDPSVSDPTPDNSTDVPGATTFAGTGSGSTIAQFIDVNKGDGDRITGLAKFGSALVIFKERAIYQMTFDASGVPIISQVSGSIGCVSHKSIDNVENDVFFLTRGGYYVLGNEPNYFSVIRTNELSSRIHPIIDTITAANLGRAASIYSGFIFYGAIPSGGTMSNNALLTYDRRYLGWSESDNVNANAFTEFVDSNNVKHLYYASDDEAKVFEIDTNYSDDGDAIDAFWVSKFFDAGKPEIRKHWIFCDVVLRQVAGSVDLEILLDNDEVAQHSTISNANDLTGVIGMGELGLSILGGDANITAPITTTNLITNPSFETGTTSWTKLQGAETLTQDTTHAQAGSYSLKCVTTNAADEGPLYNVAGLIAGTTVTGSMYVWAALGQAFTIQFDTFTAGSAYISSFATNGVGTGDWQRIEVTGLLPATCTNVNLFCKVASVVATFWIDAVQFETATAATDYFDGSTADTSLSLYDWTGTAHASVAIHTAFVAGAIVNAAANTRNVVYRIPINKDSKGAKLRVSNSNNNETFTLLAFVFRYRDYSPYNFDSANILQG